MLRTCVAVRCAVLAVLAAGGVLLLVNLRADASAPAAPAPAAPAAVDSDDPRILDAEVVLRLAAEQFAARIQRSVSSNVNMVMAVKPATSFKVRNAIRAGQNSVRSTSELVRARFEALLTRTIDELLAAGAPIADVSRLFEAFDTEGDEQLRDLTSEGFTDLASLIRNGRRSASVRGTLVGRYELFVSQIESGRDPVKLGEVSLGESQMVRGAISTAAAAEFFLDATELPTPHVAPLPETTALMGVRWLYRAGPLVVSTPDSRATSLAGVDQNTIVIRGIDLLPEQLRIALERELEGSPDITTNPDGADGFFRSVTYTFRRIVEEP